MVPVVCCMLIQILCWCSVTVRVAPCNIMMEELDGPAEVRVPAILLPRQSDTALSAEYISFRLFCLTAVIFCAHVSAFYATIARQMHFKGFVFFFLMHCFL